MVIVISDFPPYRTLIYRIGESFLTLVLCVFSYNPLELFYYLSVAYLYISLTTSLNYRRS